MSDDTYPMPPDGWVCFHCGERFTTPGTAEDHFGKSPDDTAACKIKVGEERGLVMEMRRAQEQAEEQLQRALQAERDLEAAECRIASLTTAMQGYKPFAKCRSINEVFFVFDSMEGRALAAEERERVLVEAVGEAGFAVYLTDAGKTFLKVWNPTSGIPQAR